MILHPVPAFTDNYLWVLHDDRRALAVDPGDPQALGDWLDLHGLELELILVTHHHPDHTGGVAALRGRTGARVVGPADEPMPEPLQRVGDGETVEALGLRWQVMSVPGHTRGHLAYVATPPGQSPVLFCGDTLFSGGCGRLFEGTPAQMHHSLQRLAALPDDTRVCCAHEYTLSNLRFARAVEPHNPVLQAHGLRCESLRAQGLPTLPSTLALERDINPFLRTQVPDVRAAARAQPEALGLDLDDDVNVLAVLRAWKNRFS